MAHNWTPEEKAELSNLFHLAATALAGSGQRASRYQWQLWASKEFEKLHPEVCSTAAYKQLCRDAAWRWSR